jgi:ABC-2 type transport system permease protein
MRRFVQRTLVMAEKELTHIMRDPQVLVFALGMPVVLILLFGYAVSFDVDDIPLVVVDQDQSRESRELIAAFTASGSFSEVAERQDPEQVETLFRRGVARAALVIPPDFEERGKRNAGPRAQLLLDGSDNMTAGIALGYANSVALASSQRSIERTLGTAEPPLEVRPRTLFNPGLVSSVFLVPGLIVVILVMIAVMLTALTVAREYERGSMEQLFTTPVSRMEVILGKLGPYFVLGLVQVLLVLTVGVNLFDVPVRGSLWLLFGVASVFLLAMLMQGLLISVVTRSQMVASQVAVISTMLPALLLSGFMFPIENMPLPLQAIATVLPARYFVHAIRAILLRGNGIEVLALDLAAMAAFFLVLLTIATARFRRTVA